MSIIYISIKHEIQLNQRFNIIQTINENEIYNQLQGHFKLYTDGIVSDLSRNTRIGRFERYIPLREESLVLNYRAIFSLLLFLVGITFQTKKKHQSKRYSLLQSLNYSPTFAFIIDLTLISSCSYSSPSSPLQLSQQVISWWNWVGE